MTCECIKGSEGYRSKHCSYCSGTEGVYRGPVVSTCSQCRSKMMQRFFVEDNRPRRAKCNRCNITFRSDYTDRRCPCCNYLCEDIEADNVEG